MFDLKAELHRKREELIVERQRHGNTLKPASKIIKKDNVVRNPGVEQRGRKDTMLKEYNDDDALLKSRLMLEQKAKIYENKIKTCLFEELNNIGEQSSKNNDNTPLIDFEKKAVDQLVKKYCDTKSKKLEKPPQAVSSKDSETTVKEFEKKSHQAQNVFTSHSLMTADESYRELLREKWEKEAKEALKNPDLDIHYANIQFDEARSHGVGYYQFSRIQKEREDQLKTLKELHEQTKKLQKKSKESQQSKSQSIQERLNKLRKRKGLNERPITTSKEKSCDPSDITVSANVATAESKLKNVQDNMPPSIEPMTKKKAPIREWDKGKTKFDEEKILESIQNNLRNERNPEFAPPKEYLDVKNKNSFTTESQKTDISKKFDKKISQNNITSQLNDDSSDILAPASDKSTDLDVDHFLTNIRETISKPKINQKLVTTTPTVVNDNQNNTSSSIQNFQLSQCAPPVSMSFNNASYDFSFSPQIPHYTFPSFPIQHKSPLANPYNDFGHTNLQLPVAGKNIDQSTDNSSTRCYHSETKQFTSAPPATYRNAPIIYKDLIHFDDNSIKTTNMSTVVDTRLIER